MLHTLITTLILTATLALALAEPPNIATLSDLTIDQAFANEQSINNNDGLVILADEYPLYPESWERSVWNDETFAQQLKDRKISVVYITKESHPAIFAMLKPSSSPAVYFWNLGKIQSERFGHSATDTPERMLEWITLARRGSTFSQELLKQLKNTPNNIGLRYELINELNRDKNEVEIARQRCWLIEQNEPWFQYVLMNNQAQTQTTNDPELDFRAKLLLDIMSVRRSLGMHPIPDPVDNQTPLQLGLDQALVLNADDAIPFASLSAFVNLRRTLESKRDKDTATDRDLFILKALTAEGDEMQQLSEEYKPYFK